MQTNTYKINHNLHFDHQVKLLTNRLLGDVATGLIKEENLRNDARLVAHEMFVRGKVYPSEIKSLFL